jgi:hypothetical protein
MANCCNNFKFNEDQFTTKLESSRREEDEQPAAASTLTNRQMHEQRMSQQKYRINVI